MEEEASNFSLKSGTDSFVSRSQDVFASLGALEDKHSAFLKATALTREKDDAELLKHNSDDEDEFMKESKNRKPDSSRCQLSQTRNADYEPRSRSRSPQRDISGSGSDGNSRHTFTRFKRPARPPHRSSQQPIPDFRKHPEKYTQYSLGDVSENDMSEKTNQKAAFVFLVERKQEREKEARKLAGLPEEEVKFDSSDAACSQGKITFSRPKQQMKSAVLDKSVKKDELLTLCPTTDNIDEDAKEYDASNVTKDDSLDRSVTESNTSSNSFKSRKNVKRHIRTKDNDADSD